MHWQLPHARERLRGWVWHCPHVWKHPHPRHHRGMLHPETRVHGARSLLPGAPSGQPCRTLSECQLAKEGREKRALILPGFRGGRRVGCWPGSSGTPGGGEGSQESPRAPTQRAASDAAMSCSCGQFFLETAVCYTKGGPAKGSTPSCQREESFLERLTQFRTETVCLPPSPTTLRPRRTASASRASRQASAAPAAWGGGWGGLGSWSHGDC